MICIYQDNILKIEFADEGGMRMQVIQWCYAMMYIHHLVRACGMSLTIINHIAMCHALREMFLLSHDTVYPKKYAHGFVVLCFVVVMQSFIMNSHEVFIHIHQGCFAGTGAIVRLPQCQWSKPDGYGKISQCTTTTKHSKAKTVCIFLGIYCISRGCELWMFEVCLVLRFCKMIQVID